MYINIYLWIKLQWIKLTLLNLMDSEAELIKNQNKCLQMKQSFVRLLIWFSPTLLIISKRLY